MNEMIARFSSKSLDVEICTKKGKEILFKKISLEKFIKLAGEFVRKNEKRTINVLDEQIIAIDTDYVVINQREQKKIVTLEKKGSYNIIFPNAIYIMEFSNNKINKIKAFAYKKYEKNETELFEYPLPNELYGNQICLGTAKKEIENRDYINALERIIATPYTHYSFSGIKGFSNSEKWFKYLEKNNFPYELLRPLNLTLKDIKV